MLAGKHLQEIRSRLGITTREVAERTQRIAEKEGNEDFYISNAWLTEVENSAAIPSIYKLYSLSVIYHIKFADLLMLFGLDVNKIPKEQMLTSLDQTHLTPIEVFDLDRTLTFPVRFDQGFSLEKTNLLSRMVEVWGEVPVGLIQHLDVRHSLYGYIGLEDFTLHPLLRPGSFVQIDQNIKKIEPLKWRSEYDRPIYFIELRDGYVCSWCELQGTRLIVIPHPLSPQSVRQYDFPSDASLVGQVTGVAMRIVDRGGKGSDGIARLPGRP